MIEIVPLSVQQCQALERAFTQGDVVSERLENLQRDPENLKFMQRFHGLTRLPMPALQPVHFQFEGNRLYDNQLITNGTCFGFWFQQHMDPNDPVQQRPRSRSLEVVVHSTWDALKVLQRPSRQALWDFEMDLIEETVRQYRESAADWPASRRQGVERLFRMEEAPLIGHGAWEKILAGHSPATVLQSYRANWLKPKNDRVRPR